MSTTLPAATALPATTALPVDEGKPFFACDTFERDFFATAPCRFTQAIALPCTPEALFEVFEDPTSWPRWAPGIGEVEWTSPKPFGPGTTRTVRFWGGMSVYEDFFVYDPPREMAFRFYGITEQIWTAFGEHYVVEPTAEGCHLTWAVAFTPAGWFARWQPLIRPAFRVNFRLYLWLLRRHVRARLGR